MADEDKHQLIRSLKREFDAKQAQLRNVRRVLAGPVECLAGWQER